MKQNKIYFSYKTTNLINNKWYIGIHKGYASDNYLGSGTLILKAIKKYGKKNFKREIIQEYSNYTEAWAAERILVNEDVVKDPNSYNLKIGGKGGWNHIDVKGDKNPMKNPEIALKVSIGIKASITEEERKSRSNRMSTLRKNGTITTHNKGKKTPQEHIDKRVASKKLNNKPNKNLGRIAGPDTPEVCERKRLAAIERCKTMDMGALSRGKKKKLKLVKCPHCNKEGYGPNMTRYHFEKCPNKPI